MQKRTKIEKEEGKMQKNERIMKKIKIIIFLSMKKAKKNKLRKNKKKKNKNVI